MHSVRLFAVAVAIVASSIAHAAPPRVTSIEPAAMNPGQTRVLTVSGAALQTVRSVAIGNARGVSVELAKDVKPTARQLQLKVSVDPDAALGDREIRLIGPVGVSEPLRLTISHHPYVPEVEPNDTTAEAMAVKLPALLLGRVDKAGDIDVYRFEARRHQRMIFNVWAERGGSALDSNLVIYNQIGREVAANNDYHGADSLLVFDVPADDVYTLEVRDLQYRGGGNYGYRIEAGQIPYLESIWPLGGRVDEPVDLQLAGYNLNGLDRLRLDLAGAKPGAMNVRIDTPLGPSNDLRFEVDRIPVVIENESNDSPDKAQVVELPASITGRIAHSGDADVYRFKVDSKQRVRMEAQTRRFDSPVDALLTLRDAGGKLIKRNDEAAGVGDARLVEMLEPGEYTLSMQDLLYGGGAAHVYRLVIDRATDSLQDFVVRFMPDTPVVHRGSYTKIWCDIDRRGGFNGPVTVELEGLPPGVTCEPVVLKPNDSGIFTIAAAPDAKLGSVPLRLKATATIGKDSQTRIGEAEVRTFPVELAYLTVLDQAPFSIIAAGQVDEKLVDRYRAELKQLQTKLETQTPSLDAAQAKWEQAVLSQPPWIVLRPTELRSTNGVTLTPLEDGSVLASGADPDMDTYTFITTTELTGITAFRIETLTHESLPGNGPGRSGGGNFVLTQVRPEIESLRDSTQIMRRDLLASAMADFEQNGYPASDAILRRPNKGWAISPQMGKDHYLIARTDEPLGYEGGSKITFAIQQNYGKKHTIGRFRISATIAEDPGSLVAVPLDIRKLVEIPAEKRSEDQKKELAAYYRTIAPELVADQQRVKTLQTIITPFDQIKALEKQIEQKAAALADEQAEWEKAVRDGVKWTVLNTADVRSRFGATFVPQDDGSVLVESTNAPKEIYTLAAETDLKSITAVRIEALPDERLPSDGPGRAPNGNFVLSRFNVRAAPKSDPAKLRSIAFATATDTHHQENFPAADALKQDFDAGWAYLPNAGKPGSAVFLAKEPFGEEGGTLLSIILGHRSKYDQHNLGRFRVSITTDASPHLVNDVPEQIVRIINRPADKRNAKQKQRVAEYYQSISPTLASLKQRLDKLYAQARPNYPPVAVKRKASNIMALIDRQPGFTGNVTVTVEGFVPGRNPNNGLPLEFNNRFNAPSVRVDGTDFLANVSINPNPQCPAGTRLIVLRAEAKVGRETIVQYSPAFELTVNNQ